MTYDTVESMEELPVKFKTWKAEMETKILCVNMGKTKIMVSGLNLNLLKKSGKNPWRLSDRCRKKCRLLWWMLVLDPQEMQRNQRLLATSFDIQFASEHVRA